MLGLDIGLGYPGVRHLADDIWYIGCKKILATVHFSYKARVVVLCVIQVFRVSRDISTMAGQSM